MSDYMSDSYIKDIKGQIKYVAQLAAAAEDFDVAQQLYAVLFDLQLREEGAVAHLARVVDDGDETKRSALAAAAGRSAAAWAREERLRLVPTMPRPTRCLKCQRTDVVLRAGLCDDCATRS